MPQITHQQIVPTGLAVTYTNAAADQTFTPGHNTFLHLVNGSGGDVDVTIPTTSMVLNYDIEDNVVTVPAGGSQLAGPFPRRYFAASNGLATISWESTTSMSFAVLRL